MRHPPPSSTLFPYTTLFRSAPGGWQTAPVTVTLTPGDALSGIASTEYRVDGGGFQNGTSVLIPAPADHSNDGPRSEEHTSELQSQSNLVCRLLLEKKKKTQQ